MDKSKELIFTFLLMLTGYLAQSQSVTVTAETGEGIYSLLRKNGISPSSASVKEFIRLNAHNLGKDNSLFTGKKYIIPFSLEKVLEPLDTLVAEIPVTPDSLQDVMTDSVLIKEKPPITEEKIPADSLIEESKKAKKQFLSIPIFGKEHEEVEKVSDQLTGNFYYLISGHGGPDPGAIGKYEKNTVSEDEYAYDVMLRLARRLLSNGATVYIIIKDPNDGIRSEKILSIDRDEVAYPDLVIPRNQKARLKQRTDIVNGLFLKHKGNYQRLIILHVDSRSEGENIDVFFYHDQASKSGKVLASQLQQTFQEKYAQFQPNRRYQGNVISRQLYVLKNTYPTAAFIELGNIRNKADQKRFIIKENREALANWICTGLIQEYETTSEEEGIKSK